MARSDDPDFDPFSFAGFIEEQRAREANEGKEVDDAKEADDVIAAERAWIENHAPPKIARLINEAAVRRDARGLIDPEAEAKRDLQARRDAAQRQLLLSDPHLKAVASLNRQKTLCVLNIVARRVVEGLRREGIEVREAYPWIINEYTLRARQYYVELSLESLDETNWVEVLTDKFLYTLLEGNPGRVPMLSYRVGLPKNVEVAGYYEYEGLIMRAICDYNIREDRRMVRLDVLVSNMGEEHVRLIETAEKGRA